MRRSFQQRATRLHWHVVARLDRLRLDDNGLCPRPWTLNRSEPAHERDTGGDGAGTVQVVVC